MATAPVTSPSPSLLSAQFRANPEFELVLFDRLSDSVKIRITAQIFESFFLLVHSTQAESSAWLAWDFGDRVQPLASGLTCKLYLSPSPEAVRDVFAAGADFLPRSRAHHFKIGSDVAGLLRPDKMVIYFLSFADLGESSTRLDEMIGGIPPHGVPFTAELAGKRLLPSLGLDPPGTATAFPGSSVRARVSGLPIASLWHSVRLRRRVAELPAILPLTAFAWRASTAIPCRAAPSVSSSRQPEQRRNLCWY